MKAKAMFKNDCEKAFDILAARPDSIFRGATGTVEMRRKLEGRGELSDGTRVFIIRPCDRFRYLIVELGWKTLAEIDQREYFNRPEEMADAVAAAVYSYEPHPKPATFRAELTPAGEQYIIPGCEKNLSPKPGQLDLFG